MSDFSPPTPLSLRDALFRWTRDHTVGALLAALAVVIVAIAQISLIGGWHLGFEDRRIPVAPINAMVATVPNEPEQLIYSFNGGSAVSATRTINIATDQVLGVRLTLNQIPASTRLNLGWVGTRDRRRPTNLTVSLPPSAEGRTIDIPLRGHNEWRDNVTQFAILFVAPAGTAPITLSRAEWIVATPANSIGHTLRRWTFADNIISVESSFVRVLPFVAFVSLAALLVYSALGWIRRDAPDRKRASLIGAMVLLLGFSALFAAIAISKTQISVASGISLVAAMAFATALFGARSARFTALLSGYAIDAGAALLAAAAVVLGGWQYAWVPVAVLLALIARRFPGAVTPLRATLFWLPLLAIGGVTQAIAAQRLSLPDIALRDPSSTLASLTLFSAPFLAALCAFALCVFFLPQVARQARSKSAALVSWFALLGTLASIAVVIPKSTAVLNPLWWLPLAVCLTAWLLPSLATPVASAAVAAPAHEKTEADLSAVVKQLFDGAAESFEAAITEGRTANALAPLNRMREIAPGSLRTRTAELSYALRGTNLESAANSYRTLLAQPKDALAASVPQAHELLLAYANRTGDLRTIIDLLDGKADNEAHARLLARAVLLSAPQDEVEAARVSAIEILRSIAKPNNLAHEIAELHLLGDEWQKAQYALAESGFTPQSLPGQIYVARLGLIATQGSQTYVDQIQKLATWNSELELAHLAMGELLYRQGKLSGARARLALVGKNDITLWAAQRRLLDVDAELKAQGALNQAEALPNE